MTRIPPHPERSTDGPWLGLRDDHEPHHPPHPERSTDGPWLGPDDNHLDDNYPDDNYPRSALTDHNVACHLVHDNHDPIPGAAPTAWPDNLSNRLPIHQGDPTANFKEDQEPHSTNEVDGEM